ncbi:uncharacterized protein F4812DRAFT_133166 [Daldinia caldariorum]|uniref:uncharacterized protein n=1 Tax=Daldinia caldariorum TaxID=326644 RepID=UPI00200728AC|nr:uncharacterized protein F4812DRAFT_133166 [Daldinia caldariorum]KAI1465126.1 hypothetical protein F4812DRAFT_133166 [Daldinia caldariorum]
MDEAWTRRRNTVNTLLDGYGSLSVPQLLQSTTPDFHHQVLPESLGMASRNRDAFAQHAAGIFNVFDEFKMIPKSIVDDGPANMTVVHARMQGILKGGAGEWINECVMMIQLSPDGTQVSRVTEFVDSAKALEMARKHSPENFDVNYSKLNGPMKTQKGARDETTGSKSVKLLFGLGLGQIVTVIVLLYLGRGGHPLSF